MPKLVAGVEDVGQAAIRIADLLGRLGQAICGEEDDEDCSSLTAAIVPFVLTHNKIRHSVVVYVACRAAGPSKHAPAAEIEWEVTVGGADFLARLHEADRVQEQDEDGPSFSTTVCVTSSSDDEVVNPVSVQVSDRRARRAEVGIGAEGHWEATIVVANLLSRLDRGACRQEEYVNRTGIRSTGVVSVCSDDQVRHSVPVQVPNSRAGHTKIVPPVEQEGQVPVEVADFLTRLDKTVGGQGHDVNCSSSGVAVVVQKGTHGEVHHAIPIQVPYRCRRPTERVFVVQCKR